MIWITSDLHLCHDRDFIYGKRGYKNVQEMNHDIITKWNAKVTADDTVYVLGDITLNDDNTGLGILSSLKGKIHIIIGNHDTDNRITMYKRCYNVEDVVYADRINYNGYTFFLSHYPTLTDNHDVSRPLEKCVLNLFGHTHSTDKFYEGNSHMYNVAWDAHHDLISLDTIIEDIKNAR